MMDGISQRGNCTMKKIGFLGAGKVGTTLGRYFAEHSVEVAGYYSRSISSASEAAAFTGSRVFETARDVLAASDVLFLTVPDGAIRTVYDALPKELLRGKILCHASGALTAKEAFPDIETYGGSGCSVHPLFAVSDKNAYRELVDVFFAVEGTPACLPRMTAWLRSIGLHAQRIDGSRKRLYHAAAVVASNHVVALFAEAMDMLEACGFDETAARAALAPLFLGNARHVAEAGPEKALTGPVERGDAATVEKHLAAFAEIGDEDDRALYRLLTKRLLRIAKAKHSERDFAAIEELVSQDV
ncbi:DUF2520 domain-containing protein [uncultured Selenomonas sp.]|uniref:Rossmann-like and DUF2520 domain-containing protein n=1 Tax=uncultured Selenomonas sp. TaxID=159275 RepID=UPI00344DF644